MSTTTPYSDVCPRCFSFPCRCAPPPQTTVAEPYFVYLRIAVALERIADALEQSTKTEPDG